MVKGTKGKETNLAIYENVKNIVGKQFKPMFDLFEKELQEYGYSTYWKVLNAKNYGVPQNRERVYLIIIKKELDNGKFKFPEGFDNGLRLKDLLETKVDDKYYLSEAVQKRFKLTNATKNIIGTTKPDFRTIGQRDLVYNPEGVVATLVATDYKQPKQIAVKDNDVIRIGSVDLNGHDICKRVYSDEGISATIPTGSSGNTIPKVLRNVRTEYGKQIRKQYEAGSIDEQHKNMTQLEPRPDEISNTISTVLKDNLLLEPQVCEQRCDEGLRFFKDDCCGSQRTTDSCGDKRVIEPPSPELNVDYRIRKLTPLECFRLMGFNDSDLYILSDNKISNAQLYKMAGNSIVVDVLYHILLEIHSAMPYLLEDVKLSSFFSGIGAFEKALLKLKNKLSEV
jgi:DNA (cytosine-5)-methyltransferase 1